MTRLLATLVFLLTICISIPTTAQAQTDIFPQTQRFGRGAVLNAQWHPNGEMILVDTVTGAWLYSNTLADVAYLPDARLARFNLDGRIIAGIDDSNNLTFWDTTTFTQIDAYAGNTAYVVALEWSPNQTQIATLDRTGRIVVWNLGTTAIQFEARLNNEVGLHGADQIAWSKNGSYLAALNLDNAGVGVWDREGAFIFHTWHDYMGSWAVDIQWRNDSQLARHRYGELPSSQSWDVANGGDLGIQGIGYSIAYSPDGLKAANGHIGTVTIVDVLKNEILLSVETESPLIYPLTIAWSPDGEQVAFGVWSSDVAVASKVFIVDAATGEILHQFDQASHSTKDIYWSADRQDILVVDGTNRLSVIPLSDAASDRGSHSDAHTNIGTTADWAGDGSKIAVADTNLGARVWDTTTGTEIIPPIRIGRPASVVVLQPGGTFVALKSGEMGAWGSDDKNVYIWDLSNREDDVPTMVIPNLDFVADIAWSPDGKTLAIAEQTEYIRLWSPNEPDVIRVVDLWAIRTAPFIDYTQRISEIQWSPDSRILNYAYSSSGNGGGVGLLDVPAGKILEGGSPNYGVDWAWTSDNRFMWVRWGRYNDGLAALKVPNYDLELGVGYDSNSSVETSSSEQQKTLHGMAYAGAKAILSPNATKVIGFDVADNAVIWDLEPQSVRVRLDGVEDAVWSPDETMLVTYGVDGVLRVIGATSGETLHSFDDHFNPAYPLSLERIKVFWSPDSRKIALLDRGALHIYEMQG